MCKGTDHLEKIFQDIMDQGGEGIILRDPSSPFEAGRSRGYLKHKVRVHPNVGIFAIALIRCLFHFFIRNIAMPKRKLLGGSVPQHGNVKCKFLTFLFVITIVRIYLICA